MREGGGFWGEVLGFQGVAKRISAGRAHGIVVAAETAIAPDDRLVNVGGAATFPNVWTLWQRRNIERKSSIMLSAHPSVGKLMVSVYS